MGMTEGHNKDILLSGIVHLITAFVLFTVEGFGYRIVAMINFILGLGAIGLVYYNYIQLEKEVRV